MTSKVYIATIGDYEDQQIAGVFTDKEKAEAYQSFIDRSKMIDDYDLDAVSPPDWFNPSLPIWNCYTMNRAPGIRVEEWTMCFWKRLGKPDFGLVSVDSVFGNLKVTIYALDADQAQEIAAGLFHAYRHSANA